MTDAEIMELLTRDITNWEKGKILRDAFDATKPSALNIKPAVQRKKRAKREPSPSPATDLLNGPAHDN